MTRYILLLLFVVSSVSVYGQIKYDDALIRIPSNSAGFGSSAESAGDVNGDGFTDLIVGERYHNNSKGAVHIYYGSANGFPGTPSWSYFSTNTQSRLGVSVSSAGDINGDGYDDIIAGAYSWKNGSQSAGKVFVWLGGANGPSQTPHWTKIGAVGSAMGASVSAAGDVNGDGFDDILMGASHDYGYSYYQGGKAWIYYGSASGVNTTNYDVINGVQSYMRLGADLNAAGDVNGDGYDDFIVGAAGYDAGTNSGHGQVRVYYGSSTGIVGGSPGWTIHGGNGQAFGVKVSGAGDLNGDGFDDVVIAGNKSYSILKVVYGSSSGLAASAGWSLGSTNYPNANSRIATKIGDVNGDGFDDLLAAGSGDKGYIFYGSSSGPGLSYDLVVDNRDGETFKDDVNAATLGDIDGDGIDEFVIGFPNYSTYYVGAGAVSLFYGDTGDNMQDGADWFTESNNVNAQMGHEVANAGDVNGDGWDDFLVGAWQYSNGHVYEGAVFLYYGSNLGLSATPDWSAEGGQHNAFFGYGLSAAGDVNNDGYADVVIGAQGHDHLQSNTGRIYVYYGSATGLASTADVIINGDQAQARIGIDVADAGDVNNDGYDDVIVGAYLYDSAQVNEGAAFIYHGSATGLSTTAATLLTSGQANAWFGKSVSTAGDINGDGYADVIVGAPKYDAGQTDEGRAFVYLGSASGVSATASWTYDGDEAYALLAFDVSWAGDNNSDGFDDIIIGAYGKNGTALEGRVYGFHGDSTGLASTPDFEVAASGTLNALGKAVAHAGDFNNDGYDDVIVGAESSDGLAGAALVYPGSATGLDSTPIWTYESSQAGARYGSGVTFAGDVNGDGIDDVGVGALRYDHGHVDEGGAFVYYGQATTGGNSPALSGLTNEILTTTIDKTRVFPNPSEGSFQVQSDQEIRQIALISMKGEKLSFTTEEVVRDHQYIVRPAVAQSQMILVQLTFDHGTRVVRQLIK